MEVQHKTLADMIYAYAELEGLSVAQCGASLA